MFRWADVIAVAAVATLAAAHLAAADRPIAGAPLDLVLPVEAVDLAVSSLDGGMSIHTNRVTLQSDVLFAFDSATLSASARGRIGGAALELAARRPRRSRSTATPTAAAPGRTTCGCRDGGPRPYGTSS